MTQISISPGPQMKQITQMTQMTQISDITGPRIASIASVLQGLQSCRQRCRPKLPMFRAFISMDSSIAVVSERLQIDAAQ